jgi:hypothetical protein
MNNDTREKLFVRLTPERAKDFREAIRRHGATLTQQDVLEQLVENYLAHEKEGQIRHLDGTICPISQLIRGLVESVEGQYRLANGALKKFNEPPPPS